MLWGLLALAVPVIVHWLNLQRDLPYAFSQLQFLQQVVQRADRRQTLKRWLLLALRLLGITALVLAMAGWRGCASQAETPTDRWLIVLDDSPSTSAAVDGVPAFEVLRRSARKVIEQTEALAEVAVVPLSQLSGGVEFTPARQAMRVLDAARVSPTSTSLARALRELPAHLPSAQSTRVLLFTDGQRSLLADSLASTGRLIEASLMVLRLEEAVSNRWLGAATLQRSLGATEKMRLVVPVHSAGSSPGAVARVSLNVEGKRVAQTNVTLSGDSGKAELSFATPRGGWVAGELEVDDPQAPYDNRVPIVLYQNERPVVAWLGGEKRSGEPMQRLRESVLTEYSHRLAENLSLASAQLAGVDLVVLRNPGAFAAGDITRLADYVQQGGGLLLWPGDASELITLNELASTLGIGRFEAEEQLSPPLAASRAELGHPWLSGAFVRPTGKESFDGPLAKRRWPFAPSATAEGAEVAGWPDGKPLAWQAQVGRGRVLVLTTQPETNWSDWADRTSLVLLMLRGVEALSQPQAWPLTVDVAEQPTIDLGRLPAEARLVQDKAEYLPPQRTRSGRTLVDLGGLELPVGVYSVTAQDSLARQLAVRLPERESDPTLASEADLQQFCERAGWSNVEVNTISAGAGLPGGVLGGGSSSLFVVLIAICLLALVGESLVTRVMP
jgi:hypothetical protein